jgi:hypothetical protein
LEAAIKMKPYSVVGNPNDGYRKAENILSMSNLAIHNDPGSQQL